MSSALNTIRLPIKIGNNGDGYTHSEETFYIVDVESRYNAIMSRPWQHTIGAVSSTLYQVMMFPSPSGHSIIKLHSNQVENHESFTLSKISRVIPLDSYHPKANYNIKFPTE